MTKEYFLFWPDEPTLENLQSAYVNLETHFSICLPNLRDYYRAEADAKKMTYEQLAKTVRIESRKHMIGQFFIAIVAKTNHHSRHSPKKMLKACL